MKKKNKVTYMIVVKPSDRMYGVFLTANDAAKWALKNFSSFTDWTIYPVRNT